MRSSETIGELASALAQFTAKIKNPPSTSEVKVPTKGGKSYSYKYVALPDMLNVVRPLLAEFGLSVVQYPGGDGNSVSITTVLLHSSGEWMEGAPLVINVGRNDAQAVGSAITYARRYSLAAVLGISSEDDDGRHATESVRSQPSAPSKPKPKPKAKPSNNEPDRADGKLVSESQLKKLFVLGSKLYDKKTDMKQDIYHKFGIDSLKAMTSKEANDVIKILEEREAGEK